ncbi:hypothetical protein [Cellulomonas iranensis]|uniref:hypothetical protein n=2 Tax=Cellulomonas iranensis TaxID=76862 RepID=UPI0011788DC4|nr:hypothetical protein [Cellulomonas iranensis]
MALVHPDARSWAEAHSAAGSVRLGMLEAMACQSYPEVVATFGDDGATIAELIEDRAPSTARRALTGLGVVLVIAALIAPVAGVAVLGAESDLVQRMPADRSVPIAAVCFALAVVVLLVTGGAWVRGGARWSGMVCGVGAVFALCGVFASISMPTVAGRDGYDLPTTMQVPVWTTLALGLLLTAVTVLRFRVRDPEPPVTPDAPTTTGDRHVAELAARGIPDAERVAILADRDAALRVLAERGLLDETTLGRALAAPLGTLFALEVPTDAGPDSSR